MGYKRTTLWSSALIVLSWAACGGSYRNPSHVETYSPGPTLAPRLDVKAPLFVSGEQLTYELSLRGVVGGEALTRMGDKGDIDGRDGIVIHSSVETVGLVAFIKQIRDDVTTWVDINTGHPFGLAADVKFGEKEASIETDFRKDKDHIVLQYSRKGSRLVKLRQRVPKGHFIEDVHSAMGLVRGWTAKTDTKATMFVLSGRRLWRNRIRITARENIETKLGKRKAFRIDGVAQRVNTKLADETKKKPRFYSVWVSDDAYRLPLLVLARTEYGDVRVELVDTFRPDGDS